MQGSSLKELVKKHGLNIKVKSVNPSVLSFTILRPSGKYYECLYEDGIRLVLQECPSTNDYILEE